MPAESAMAPTSGGVTRKPTLATQDTTVTPSPDRTPGQCPAAWNSVGKAGAIPRPTRANPATDSHRTGEVSTTTYPATASRPPTRATRTLPSRSVTRSAVKRLVIIATANTV